MKDRAEKTPAAVLEFDGREPATSRNELQIATMKAPLGDGRCLISLPVGKEQHLVAARSLVPLGAEEQGRQLAVSFEGGDPARPIVLGVIAESCSEGEREKPGTLELDADALLLTGTRELTLRCGKSSVTLKEDGKVVVRGTNVLNRSSGPVRLKGGSVSIN